jgi:hypothetical protein
MSVVTVPRGERGSRRRAVGTRRLARAFACASACCGCLAAHADGAHTTRYVGEYAGHYSFHFDQQGLQPDRGYSDEADEDFSWDVRFQSATGGPSGSQTPVASIAAGGSDRFARTGDVEDPEANTCTIAAQPSTAPAPRDFEVVAGAVAGSVDVHAIIPIFTGAAGQVSVGPSSNSLCAGLDAAGAAVNCDPFGCPWECVAFAADPLFEGAWVISLVDAPIASFPRSFQASQTMSPCTQSGVSYAAERSLDATLTVLARDPPGPPAAKPSRSRPRKHPRRRALHSAGHDRGSR